MKIVIPGGSGHVGRVLARALTGEGHEVVVLSRSPREEKWRTVAWDARTQGDWARELEGADAVLNLAGRSVNCRYTPENRRQILDSRVESTRAVGEAIERSKNPPSVWLQMSTATIYAHRFDAPNDENGIIGGDEPNVPDTWRFSIDVAKAWEAAVSEANTSGTRRILLRSAMVMSPDKDSVFDVLSTLARRGLGGGAGSGQQFMSWIHEDDFVRAVRFLLDNEINGAVNLAAPHPLPQHEFMRTLRQVWGVPIGLPATQWMLEIATWLMGTETELVLKSRRVVPGVLLAHGFKFRYPHWPEAARALRERGRKLHK
jgi:uncharacterized protein (TIGR01777 family)